MYNNVLNVVNYLLLSVRRTAMEEQAESLRMTFDKFMLETTSALSQDTKQRDRFEYSIKNKKDDMVLSWKKRLDGNDIRVRIMLIRYRHGFLHVATTST